MLDKIEYIGMETGSPFYYMLRASGHGEVWRDFTEEAKFRQYGWRCSTNEDAYSAATLMGNWSEKRFDTGEARTSRRPLPSQVCTDVKGMWHGPAYVNA